jgi:hypothetical protein
MFTSLVVAHKFFSISNICLEYFLGFNICFCSRELVENNLWLEKY